MTALHFRRALLAATAVLFLAMLGSGYAPPSTPAVRLLQVGLGLAVIIAGLLLVLAGIHQLHTSTRDRHAVRSRGTGFHRPAPLSTE